MGILGRFVALSLVLAATGCSVNPVTGERNLNFMSEDWEREIGAQQYAPLRQAQGGDFILDPELTEYVSGVGQSLAEHAVRDFDYEFHILNDSTPNAWALPGGKIVVNRGLLTKMDSEAELAAVLGHEIVHADAAHGAQSQSTGALTQVGAVGGMILLGTQVDNQTVQQIGMLGIQVGAALVTTAYGREAERESDLYGMKYMSAAGYDPQGAVELQQTFVELSEGRNQDWLSGLFSSHPPSQERVDNNIATAATLPAGGEFGRKRYKQMVARLEAMQPAYDAYDEGRKAFNEEDFDTARQLGEKAIRLEPREALFYGLVGDGHAMQERYRKAIRYYSDALSRDDGFFYYFLRRGQVNHELGRADQARRDLERSNELLPTAQANYLLGNIAQGAGDQASAMQYYQAAAADSGSQAGQWAQREIVMVDLPQNPSTYIRSQAFIQGNNVGVAVGNASPVTVTQIVVLVRYLDSNGQVRQFNQPINQTLPPQQQTSVLTRLSGIPADALNQRVAVEVVDARIVKQ